MNRFLKNESANFNRQYLYLLQYYTLNGAVSSAWTEYIVENLSFLGDNTFAYAMPIERFSNVDSSFDFELCEFIMKSKSK
ncbi:MAG: hypothetical protein ACYC6P_08695 [Ignavibacteriaceae bacterium]